MKHLRNIITAFVILLSSLFASAQQDTTICFINIYPGADIYELEGHSAIAVFIDGQEPVAYNFGVFDFNAPNFVYRFVKGKTDYKAVETPWKYFIWPYFNQHRRVVAHELNFDSDQKARLIELLKENVKPENATYRYNYVKDNCATRPLKAVEKAAGDSIQLSPGEIEANSSIPITFRNVMRHYHSNYPWYQFGIDLALGSGIDYPLTRRELAFAPAELDGMLHGATVGGRPLVKSSRAIVDFPADGAIEGPTPWYLSPIFVCWLFFFITFAITIRDWRRGKPTRWFDAAFFSLIGLTGCLLTFLIFVSVHEATSPNWLYAWLNPAALLVPCLIWLKRTKIVIVCYQIVNFAVLFTLLAIWYFLPQSANAAFLPLILAEMMRSANYLHANRIKR